ncbi:hypothetical protein AAMO2058_001271500 [Amorphochlora amoebiformis]|uniref:Serine/threonine-protein phosphatase n=1 Tax=Amorphochlora amoebiformis TaxID=1561963 RepID=A0A7S0CY40_9EUKA|mmetsp:Transcript_15922/g.25207  ORF Transcript_15922/g.25207 Transcript_15922/m.25207 type:complete len:793 (+) Transcript_15922:231-2609(+)
MNQKKDSAKRIQALFRGALARTMFKRMRLRAVTRQFDLLEERQVVFSRKQRVEAKEEFKKKLEAIKRDLMRNDKKDAGKLEALPSAPIPTLTRGHTDFKVEQMSREWKKQEERAEKEKKHSKKAESIGLPIPHLKPSLVREQSTPGTNLAADQKITLDFVTAMLDRFKKLEKLDEKTAYRIVEEAKEILKKEENVQTVNVPKGARLAVVGDLHGQLDDLVHIFGMNGLPSSRNLYLFNGDFVDRGKHSCEVVFTLLAFKILYPSAVFLNRGNHEATDINEEMGFCAECTRKYSRAMWTRISDAFRHLPVCSVVNDEVFVVHGGLCWEDLKIEQINKFSRDHLYPPYESHMEDLLWSDPLDFDEDTGLPFSGRGRNEMRNDAGCVFGPDVATRFLKDNEMKLIVRSHECVDAGYEWTFPNLCTVFSASRYRGKDDNLGAVMLLSPRQEEDKKVQKPMTVYNGPRLGTLDISFISYEAAKMAKARGFCLRFAALENQILTLLIRHISANRLLLIDHFDSVSKKEGKMGRVTRIQWKNGLNKVLGVQVPFLSFQDMLGLPLYGVDGKWKGPVDYISFLSRFAPLYRHLTEDMEVSKGSPTSQRTEGKSKKANELLGHLLEAAKRSKVGNVETLFRYFDFDGDGRITVDEFKIGLLSLQKVYPDLSFTAAEVEEVASTLGDASGVISYLDFFENVTVADKTYGKLVALDNKAESLQRTLDSEDLKPSLRKKVSDEIQSAQRARDGLDLHRLMSKERYSVRAQSLGAPSLSKAKSLPAGWNARVASIESKARREEKT